MEKDFYDELNDLRERAKRLKEEESKAAKMLGGKGAIQTVRTSRSHMRKEDMTLDKFH